MTRPVPYYQVFLSYVGIFLAILFGGLLWVHESQERDAAIARQAQISDAGFCKVILNSHQAARDDYKRLRDSVKVSKDYLADKRGDPALRKIVKTRLPLTIAARNTARNRMVGLRPPETCKTINEVKEP